MFGTPPGARHDAASAVGPLDDYATHGHATQFRRCAPTSHLAAALDCAIGTALQLTCSSACSPRFRFTLLTPNARCTEFTTIDRGRSTARGGSSQYAPAPAFDPSPSADTLRRTKYQGAPNTEPSQKYNLTENHEPNRVEPGSVQLEDTIARGAGGGMKFGPVDKVAKTTAEKKKKTKKKATLRYMFERVVNGAVVVVSVPTWVCLPHFVVFYCAFCAPARVDCKRACKSAGAGCGGGCTLGW